MKVDKEGFLRTRSNVSSSSLQSQDDKFIIMSKDITSILTENTFLAMIKTINLYKIST
jgi:hypothetical protein